MSAVPDTVAGRITEVRDRISAAAAAAGRSAGDIELIAVTKTVAIGPMAEAAAAGIVHFGENHVQEMIGKYENFPEIKWHMIGHLQSNKVKYIIGKCALIQSVDRSSLAGEIHKRSRRAEIVQPVLIEVNIGREPQKSGVMPEDLWTLMDAMLDMDALCIRGLMTVPPLCESSDEVRPWFAGMRRLMQEARKRYPGTDLPVLSMGMSGDYETAVAEGATMVRVGSAIFGRRPPHRTAVQQEK